MYIQTSKPKEKVSLSMRVCVCCVLCVLCCVVCVCVSDVWYCMCARMRVITNRVPSSFFGGFYFYFWFLCSRFSTCDLCFLFLKYEFFTCMLVVCLCSCLYVCFFFEIWFCTCMLVFFCVHYRVCVFICLLACLCVGAPPHPMMVPTKIPRYIISMSVTCLDTRGTYLDTRGTYLNTRGTYLDTRGTYLDTRGT